MFREKIYLERIRKFIAALTEKRYSRLATLEAEFTAAGDPIPYEEIPERDFRKISRGEKWGSSWDSAWFRFRGRVPEDNSDRELGVYIDLEGEACVWKEGQPWYGLTAKVQWAIRSGKFYIPLTNVQKSPHQFDLLVEAAANGLFGSGEKDYHLKAADLVKFDRDRYRLEQDMTVLDDLARALQKNSPRRNRIIAGLNDICNTWQEGAGLNDCLKISVELLSCRAGRSSLSAYSVGHAHLDLAWLWPFRETRRKAGRTFATALRLLDEYDDYVFGASQPQLYQWVKEDYPGLYEQVKQAVAQGRWECQGAMWVESDTNLPSGESLIRQCLYGIRYFREEFGIRVENLWLPDVFGYSAALPQILVQCGIKSFMTQKISWNETNPFPHHTFLWRGIDGSTVLTHFLPANDYNLANLPSQLIAAENRYTQNYLTDEFLNLYGIGDGGGGPGREHLELGIRQKDLEGAPRFRFSRAQEFFDRIHSCSTENFPVWSGELYLELHRGTYTTQALIKKNNRILEQLLHDVEFLGSLLEIREYPFSELEKIWKETLLNQFHDILPGSSISRVYQEANQMAENNIERLREFTRFLISQLHGEIDSESRNIIVYNFQPWSRKEMISLPGEKEVKVEVPASGYSAFRVDEINDADERSPELTVEPGLLENELIRIEFGERGEISSIYDKEFERQILSKPANDLQLWEDIPNNWGAWDINHFYRETIPTRAELLESRIVSGSPLKGSIEQRIRIGNSDLVQRITLTGNSRLIRIWNQIEWKETHKMLRVTSKPDLTCTKASCEIQFGILERPTHSNTSWDAARFEVPAQRFVDLSEPDYGFALLNDCKYGYSIFDNTLELCLLRSPEDTDPKADLHTHEFTYAYYPHPGDFPASDTLQQAHNLNDPLLVIPLKVLPEQRITSYYTIEGEGVKLETVKPSENHTGILVRFYETCGKRAQIKFSTRLQLKSICEVNLLEEEVSGSQDFSGQIKLNFRPFELRSFLLKF